MDYLVGWLVYWIRICTCQTKEGIAKITYKNSLLEFSSETKGSKQAKPKKTLAQMTPEERKQEAARLSQGFVQALAPLTNKK